MDRTSQLLADSMIELAQRIEAAADADGWDQLPSVWGVYADPHTGDEVSEQLGGHAVAWQVRPFAVFDASPVEALADWSAPPDMVGVAVVFESFMHSAEVVERVIAGGPEPDFGPSEDPNRREQRQVRVILRSGVTGAALRFRGQASYPMPMPAEPVDELGYVLRRAVGLPSGAELPAERPGSLAALWVVMIVAKAAAHAAERPDFIGQFAGMFALGPELTRRLGAVPAAEAMWLVLTARPVGAVVRQFSDAPAWVADLASTISWADAQAGPCALDEATWESVHTGAVAAGDPLAASSDAGWWARRRAIAPLREDVDAELAAAVAAGLPEGVADAARRALDRLANR